MKTYATITDLGNLEVRDAIMGDDAVATLESAQVDVVLDRVTSLLLERGLVVWVDGYDEESGRTYLNQEGFRMNLDEALEGADFWEAVSDVLEVL